MPRYEIGGHTFRRKNLYMPCVLGADFDGMSDEEKARVYRETYWADNIAASEWKAVLGHDDCTPSAKSRLKKKAAGWVIALGRIAALNEELFREVVERALSTYEEQIRADYPTAEVTASLFMLDAWRAHLAEANGKTATVHMRLGLDEED
jgi:hypothetical protein